MTQYKGAFVMFLLALSSPAPAAAQDGGGFGRVVDKTGAVLPGSTVALSGPEGTRVTQSDGSGEYAFANVSAGTHTLTAALSGFSEAMVEGLCQGNSPRGTIPGCTFDDPATFGIAFRLKSSATPSGCITDTA